MVYTSTWLQHHNQREVVKRYRKDWVLSAGVINGRNVWRADLATLS